MIIHYMYYVKKEEALPTETGLIRIPSSLCASSGLSQIFLDNTFESQSVLTKVVRPVPEAPVYLYIVSLLF